MDLSPLDRYESQEQFIEAIKQKTFATEVECHGCAQVVVQTFLDELGVEDRLVSMAASPFFAGLALTGSTCGALIGPLMVLGLVFGRQDIHEGLPGLIKGVRPMRKLVKFFNQQNQGKQTCLEITGVDMASPEESQAYFQAGGLERCANLMATAAGYAAGLIYEQRQSQK